MDVVSRPWTSTIFVFNFFITIPAQTIPRTCPRGYSQYFTGGNRCYRQSNVVDRWGSANWKCNNEGAHLPIIPNEATNIYFEQFVLKGRWSTWLGLYRWGSDDAFIWFGRSPVMYNKWSNGQSREGQTLPGSWCAYVSSDTQLWHSNHCNSYYLRFICEKRASITPHCPSEYAINAERNTCVKIHRSQTLSWKDAREKCGNIGGDLVVVSDSATSNFIKDILVDDSLQCWIGLSNSTSTGGNFTWVHGDAPLEFENWNSGFPVSLEAQFPTSCTAMVQDGLRWENHDCAQAKHFVCEKEVFQPVFCPGEGWILDPTDKKCYKVEYTAKKTWRASRETCFLEGGDLVSVTDTVTWNFVQGLMSVRVNSLIHFWIGLRDPYGNNTFSWVDGSGVNVTIGMPFFNNVAETCGISIWDHGRGNYYITDSGCNAVLPYICKKEPSKDYPTMSCPNGFTSHFTQKGGWYMSCLKANHTASVTYQGAEQACESGDDGGYLYALESAKDVRDFVESNNFLIAGLQYWLYNYTRDGANSDTSPSSSSSSSSCTVFNTTSGVSEQAPCEFQAAYICRAPGSIHNMINVTNLKPVSDDVYIQHYDNGPYELQHLSDVCEFETVEVLLRYYASKGIAEATAVITVEIDPSYSIETVDNKQCLNVTSSGSISECCTEVAMRHSTNILSYTRLPMEKLLCLCPKDVVPPQDPTPISQESVDTLRNLTSSQNSNGSITQNKLCPCPCARIVFDSNPSPEALSNILSKITKELIVETNVLSTKRNKKISAGDSRAESQTIGYLSLVLCFVPFCFIVGTDLIRVFQFFEKRSRGDTDGTADEPEDLGPSTGFDSIVSGISDDTDTIALEGDHETPDESTSPDPENIDEHVDWSMVNYA